MWFGFMSVVLGLAAALIVFSLQSQRPIAIKSITPAKNLDSAYRPVEPTESFGPYDTFYVSVELQNYRAGDPLYAQWYYERIPITQTALNVNLNGDIFAGFVLRNEQPPWPPGAYRVEILHDDQVLGSAAFRVEESP